MMGADDVQIIPIAQRHTESFHTVFDTIARERRYLTYLEAPPLPATRDYIARVIENNWPFNLAVLDDAAVGWCSIVPKSQPILAHCAVLGMGLLPQMRGHGIGRRLIEPTMARAVDQGLTRIELTVFSDNDPAIALYRKLGFSIEGKLRNDALIDGRYHNALMMAWLAEPAP